MEVVEASIFTSRQSAQNTIIMKTISMRFQRLVILTAIGSLTLAPVAFAQLTIPYADGSDGALNISNNTVIDLSQAGTGVWTNTSASPGNGTYDPTQWAVVFKYSTVNIASGATVSFANHPTHAPVVWLVNGNVTINGTLSLNGYNGGYGSLTLIEPGPGGFRGGASFYGAGSGLGPGGGYQSPGVYLNYSYGNTNIIPLIGGSGAGSFNGYDGGGGGGAILIAASGSITINGSCYANGGYSSGYRLYGSGGAVRLVANQILGNGSIQAVPYANQYGDLGRIRLEGNMVANTLTVYPAMPGATPANPPVIFPPASAPTCTILSVGGVNAPADPRAAVPASTTANGDVAIATTGAATILVQTLNFPTNGTVNVYIRPVNGSPSVLPASLVSGNNNQAIWQVSTTLPIYSPLQNQPGYAVIQARAVGP